MGSGGVDRGVGFLGWGVGILYPYIPSRARVIGFSFRIWTFDALKASNPGSGVRILELNPGSGGLDPRILTPFGGRIWWPGPLVPCYQAVLGTGQGNSIGWIPVFGSLGGCESSLYYIPSRARVIGFSFRIGPFDASNALKGSGFWSSTRGLTPDLGSETLDWTLEDPKMDHFKGS